MNKQNEIKKLNMEYSKLPKAQANWDLSPNFVPGDGPLDASVMFIGQAPGRNEDIDRKPFIGQSGKLLDKLMLIAGIDRKSIYITSVVQFFPPENRIPTKEEIALCKDFLFRQIQIIDPKLVVLLGSVACKTVLGLEKIKRIHGKVVNKRDITYFVSLHPAAAVRIKKNLPIMQQDFGKLRTIVKKTKAK